MFDIVVENNEKKEIEGVSITKQSDNCFWVSITTVTKRPETIFGSGVDKDKKKYLSVHFFDNEKIIGDVKIYSKELDMFSFYRGFIESRYGVDFLIFSSYITNEIISSWSLA